MKFQLFAKLLALCVVFQLTTANAINFNGIANGSFEGGDAATLDATHGHRYGLDGVPGEWDGTGCGWARKGTWFQVDPPDGDYAAILQKNSIITNRFVASTAFDYAISLDVIARPGDAKYQGLEISVLLDDTVVIPSVAVTDTTRWTQLSGSIEEISTGWHTLKIIGVKPADRADPCAAIDNVAVKPLVSVRNVAVNPRFPWENKLEVGYSIGGSVSTAQTPNFTPLLEISATDRMTGDRFSLFTDDRSFRFNTGIQQPITIEMDKLVDVPPIDSTNVVLSVAVKERYNENIVPQYCVVNLARGADAETYPVEYLTAEPAGGFNTDEYKTTKLVLKLVQSGTFIEGRQQLNEAHRVWLTEPFYCGIFKVTQQQFELVMGTDANNSAYKDRSNAARFPIDRATYDEAAEFLDRLGERAGISFCLPSEAQREYVYRAGTTNNWYYGSNEDSSKMWYKSNSKVDGAFVPHPVGEKGANPWGFYDMAGNMWEMCADVYCCTNTNEIGWMDGTPPKYGIDPLATFDDDFSHNVEVRAAAAGIPIKGYWHILRGGCFDSDEVYTRSYARRWLEGNDKRFFYAGFRLVMPVALPERVIAEGTSAPFVLRPCGNTLEAGIVEPLTYNARWWDDNNYIQPHLGVFSEIRVNGELLAKMSGEDNREGSGTRIFNWAPSEAGTYALELKVTTNGVDTAFARTATYRFSPVAIGRSQLAAIDIPANQSAVKSELKAWLKQNYPLLAETDAAGMAKAEEVAVNGRSVLDCFVAGLDPNAADSEFRALITMDGDEPVVTVEPPAIPGWRVYRLLGANAPDGKYEQVPPGRERDYRFFKVTVDFK